MGNTEKKIFRTMYIVMLTFAIYLAVSTAPYSPINSHTGYYNTSLPEPQYSVLYGEFEKVISFIPNNDPYVVFGNSEPELLPRPQLPNAPILETPYGITYNLTYKDLYGNNFTKPYIQYVIGNPYGIQFTEAETSPYNLSMFDLLNRLYDSGLYGIVAEASGIILLENNYSGPIKYFVPMSLNLSPSYLNAPYIQGYVPYKEGNLVYTLTGPLILQNDRTLNGPMFLPPGYYKTKLQLAQVYKTNQNSSLNIQIRESNGNLLGQYNYTPNTSISKSLITSFYISSMQENLYLNVYLKNMTVGINSLDFSQQVTTYIK